MIKFTVEEYTSTENTIKLGVLQSLLFGTRTFYTKAAGRLALEKLANDLSNKEINELKSGIENSRLPENSPEIPELDQLVSESKDLSNLIH